MGGSTEDRGELYSHDIGPLEDPHDYLRRTPSGVTEAMKGDLRKFGISLMVAQAIDEAKRRLPAPDFAGLRVTESYSVPPRTAILCSSPPVILFGIGLERGVPYTAPGVERGYLVGNIGRYVRLIDATTGREHRVDASTVEDWNGYTCSCTGCWACTGRVMDCTCDVDWDALHEHRT